MYSSFPAILVEINYNLCRVTEMYKLCTANCNLVPRACDPWEGNSGIIRFREESDWPLKIEMNAYFNLSQDSWLPATDYPRAFVSFPRIAGSGNEIALIAAEGSTLFFTSPFPVRELYAAKKSILGCLYIRKDDQIYDVF